MLGTLSMYSLPQIRPGFGIGAMRTAATSAALPVNRRTGGRVNLGPSGNVPSGTKGLQIGSSPADKKSVLAEETRKEFFRIERTTHECL
jgi:hypothetical protein